MADTNLTCDLKACEGLYKQKGFIRVIRGFSGHLTIEKWLKPEYDRALGRKSVSVQGTPAISYRIEDCAVCGKPNVAFKLAEGLYANRPNKAELLIQHGLGAHFPWWNELGDIDACALHDVTICGDCRESHQKVEIEQYEIKQDGCLCRNCQSCKQRFIALGRECRCVYDGEEFTSCERCKSLFSCKCLKLISKKQIWMTRKSRKALGALVENRIMTMWDINPVSLMTNAESKFMAQRLNELSFCPEGLPGGQESLNGNESFRNGLIYLTHLGGWETAVKLQLHTQVSYKRGGFGACVWVLHDSEWFKCELSDAIIITAKDMTFKQCIKVCEPKDEPSYFTESNISVYGSSQSFREGTAKLKIIRSTQPYHLMTREPNDEDKSRIEILDLTVLLNLTGSYLGIGECIQGVNVYLNRSKDKSDMATGNKLIQFKKWISKKFSRGTE